jgi:hypothetical protein
MRRIPPFFCALGLALAWLVPGTPASAQATRTWVSGVGDDVNPCSRTAPCKTFAGAISKTATNGEINCIDPGGFGAVTITKSVTIDCREVFGSILSSGTSGVIINFNSFAAADTRRTVRLRNLTISGADTGIVGIRIIGGAASAGSEVFIEHVVIDGIFASLARGIFDERSGGGELSISDTTVRNIGATGIVILPAAGAPRLDVTLDNVRVQNANFGMAVGGGGPARVVVNNSVFSGNTQAGIEAEGPAGAAQVHVGNSVSSNNGFGVMALGGAVIRLSNNDIAFNTVAGFSGPTVSFGNNRVSGPVGTAPTPVGQQ